MKVNIPGYDPTTGELTETPIQLDPTPTDEEADYEIEIAKNQNRLMSLWNEIVQ